MTNPSNASPRPLRLVIGYGNTIRQDDGVGYRVAEFLAQHPPHLSFCDFKAIAVHQLTPDLAMEVAQATEVIFVDMVALPEVATSVKLQPLTGQTAPQTHLGHLSDPQAILDLSDRLFEGRAQGYWLLIPGACWEMGEDLSPLAQRGFEQALAILQGPLIHEGYEGYEGYSLIENKATDPGKDEGEN